MTITITAFANSPDRGRGLARDMRVRWALEEVGLSYQVRALSFEALKQPEHLSLNPFGQIPTYEEDGVTLFETGAIVLHIAERHEGLLPKGAQARARAMAWMFAALNTVEPPIFELTTARLLEPAEPWAVARMPIVEARVHAQLRPLIIWLGERDWLEEDFSAGDLLMIAVLRRLEPSGLLAAHPTLAAYVARGAARPAYQRAFAAQQALFLESQTPA